MTDSSQPVIRTTETMDAETLVALRGSIAKWEGIVKGTEVDRGVNNCPLCQKFTVPTDSCDGCPVNDATNDMGCCLSPYDEWHRVNPWTDETPDRRAATTDEHRAAAQAEVDFLKSLLPSDPEPPDPDGECFRGGEYEAAVAQAQANILRDLK